MFSSLSNRLILSSVLVTFVAVVLCCPAPAKKICPQDNRCLPTRLVFRVPKCRARIVRLLSAASMCRNRRFVCFKMTSARWSICRRMLARFVRCAEMLFRYSGELSVCARSLCAMLCARNWKTDRGSIEDARRMSFSHRLNRVHGMNGINILVQRFIYTYIVYCMYYRRFAVFLCVVGKCPV